MQNFIKEEEQRLSGVCLVVDKYSRERLEKISRHAKEMSELEDERYAEQYAREKDRLTREIRDLSLYDPSKFNPLFEYVDEPYISGLVINDDNPKIGRKHYLFGKQGLSDPETRAQIVIDWREARISKLYYEWEEKDEYEEDINGIERTGVIDRKISYGIKKRELLSVKTGSEYAYKKNGIWADKKGVNISISKKEESEDHRLVDIVSLISSAQFKMITQNHQGCFYVTGGAGSGKTTVALHRLSYLLYNHPKTFNPEKCLVVMFNRSLRDYVAQTSKDLLTSKMPVDTFYSWISRALKEMQIQVVFSIKEGQGLSYIKKSLNFYKALQAYLENSEPHPQGPLCELGRFYQDKNLLKDYFNITPKLNQIIEDGIKITGQGKNTLSYDDSGVLFYIAARRIGGEVVPRALNWHDHVLADEAQDLSLIELKCLHMALSGNKSMTICADKKQQILDFVDSDSFDSFQMDLKDKSLLTGGLGVSYRSTKQIMDLASKVAGVSPPSVAHEGPAPRFHSFESQEKSLKALFTGIKKLTQTNPKGLYAIICRYKKDSMLVYNKLKSIEQVRLQTHESGFNPGIMVVNIHQVKGLEFSGVILWNPSRKSYPDTKTGRNLLYVAITRASKNLAVYHHEPLSKNFS